MSADVWSLVESSKPELIDKWDIQTRWRVKYAPCPTFEGMKNWAVLAPGAVIPAARFPTWAEALTYADLMARTREVALPRPTRLLSGRPEFDFSGESGLDYNTPRTALYEGALDLENGCDTAVLIPREHWRPLALALLALAEQEGV